MSRTTGKKTETVTGRVFLGLDLSLTSSGVVFLDDKGTVKYAKTIKVKSKGAERLFEIYEIVRSCCMKLKPQLVCIEGYAMGSKYGREAAGELGGVIRMLLYSLNIPFYIVQPTSLKLFVLGKGVGEKDQIQMHVYKNWGFEAPDNDTADAFSLSKIAHAVHDLLSGRPMVLWSKEQLKTAKLVAESKEEKLEKKRTLRQAKEDRRRKKEEKYM